ncbi:MAG: thioredoxin-like domain-containing protein [Spartobacteria bacterium]
MRAVMQELATRHFADKLDFAKEEALVKAGANAELIAALNKGTYALPAEQNAAAQQAIVDQTKRRALEAERAKKFNTLYQDQVARERSAKASAPALNVISEAVKGDLVRVQNERVEPAAEGAMANKKLIALFFSAHWCPPCRKFTPQLVEYYNRVISQHPEVENLFVRADHTANEMQNYMREVKMPWPAIEFEKTEAKEALLKYAGKGIPCLVLVDPTGRVVSDSYDGEKYLGPAKVIADMDTIFASVTAKKVAATP